MKAGIRDFKAKRARDSRDVENIYRDYGVERGKVRDYGNPIGDPLYGQSSILAKKQ